MPYSNVIRKIFCFTKGCSGNSRTITIYARGYKIYSLHEPDVYCIGKGKDHAPYEYGNKVSIASTPLKKVNRYQRNKKRKRCQRRAAIGPNIGHLKADYRLARNFLKARPVI